MRTATITIVRDDRTVTMPDFGTRSECERFRERNLNTDGVREIRIS